MVRLDEEIEKVKKEQREKKCLDKLYGEIRELVGKEPLYVDEKIKLLAEEYNKKETLIRKQLSLYEKEKKQVEKEAGRELTEKQFYILKKYASKDNEMLQQSIEEGLEYINMNDMVRAQCKTFLNKILRERGKNRTLKEEVLSLMQRKMYGEATEIIVKEIEEKEYIYTTKTDAKPEVWVYKEGIYQPDGESHIKEILREIMEENYSEWLYNQIISKIKADTFIDPELFFKDGDEFEIPVQNGILNLKTLELKEFNPTKIFKAKLPIKYKEGEACPLIDKFLSEILSCPEDKDVFYELAGFGLIKNYFLEKAFMLVGNGRNGKSRAVELLKRLVGYDNCASVPLSSIDSNSPFVWKLWKRFFNCAGDINSKDLRDTAMFKQLTGGDMISANIKFKNAIEFHNYAKLVFACNDLPRVYDYSDGFWERWVLLEFPYKFVTEDVYKNATEEEKKNWKIKDPNIIDKVTTPEEMSGFLNMAILGLHRILKNKKFSYTKGTVEVKNRWIRKADSFMAFCMDMLVGDYDSRITKKELRKRYKEYCVKHKVAGVSDRSIKATLQEMFGVSEEYGKITDFNSNSEYIWTGINWKK